MLDCLSKQIHIKKDKRSIKNSHISETIGLDSQSDT